MSVRCVAGRVHGEALVAQIEGVDDRDRAAALKGQEIGVARSSLPPAGEDEIYWADLVGLVVMNREQRVLGRVAAVTQHGAHPLLQVSREGGEGPHRLIPFVPDVIDAVDLATGRIEVDWGEDY